MNARDAIEQRLRKKMMRMREALDRFDDVAAERERVGPNWNVRDLVGHFVFWTGEGAARLPEIARGEKTLDYNLDKVNAEVYRKNKRMSYVMLLPQLRTAEENLLAALKRVPPENLIGETPVRSWLDTHADHYDHHWASLKSAADRIGRD